MPTIDLETAITEFLTIGQRLQAIKPLTGQRVLDELTAWYRDTRIEGAAIYEDLDMLLLQWGATRPLLIEAPMDLRESDDDLEYAEKDLKYLDFTRQIMPTGDEDDEDFDDAAIQMSITLGFAPADGTEESENQWISTPDDIDAGKTEYLSNAFVKSFIETPASVVAISVGHV